MIVWSWWISLWLRSVDIGTGGDPQYLLPAVNRFSHTIVFVSSFCEVEGSGYWLLFEACWLSPSTGDIEADWCCWSWVRMWLISMRTGWRGWDTNPHRLFVSMCVWWLSWLHTPHWHPICRSVVLLPPCSRWVLGVWVLWGWVWNPSGT